MAAKLNRRAFDHAQDLVAAGEYVIDDRDAWSEHQPSAQRENEFVRQHGIGEFAKWYLGIDDQHDPDTKGHLHGMLELPRRTA
jgi:hypothetical protein